jgi:hypothetical protein
MIQLAFYGRREAVERGRAAALHRNLTAANLQLRNWLVSRDVVFSLQKKITESDKNRKRLTER